MLEKGYGKDLVAEYEKSYGHEGLMELARKSAQQGVFYKAAVFDGPHFENDIQPLLTSVDIPDSGTFRLLDGRTGEYLDQQ